MSMFSTPLSEYERAMVPLAGDRGQQLAASVSDAALPRLLAASDAFEPQREGSWCCLAALRTALRTLAALAPHGLSADVVDAYTQEQLFEIERAARGQAAGTRQLGAGVSLAEAELLVADLGLQSQLRVTRRSAAEADFAEQLCSDLTTAHTTQFLMVNVLRQVAGRWTGHWMCAVAHAVSGTDGTGGASSDDWVLVLDPAAHKLGPHWLPTGTLVASMATLNVRNEARGYLKLALKESHAPEAANQQAAGLAAPREEEWSMV